LGIKICDARLAANQGRFHRDSFVYDLVFCSFATLTSLGSNGIIPVTPQARSLSVLEAILGILYLAVLVSRMIGAYRPDENT
jgi:hypothetical protein